jgi:hypothetical protein
VNSSAWSLRSPPSTCVAGDWASSFQIPHRFRMAVNVRYPDRPQVPLLARPRRDATTAAMSGLGGKGTLASSGQAERNIRAKLTAVQAGCLTDRGWSRWRWETAVPAMRTVEMGGDAYAHEFGSVRRLVGSRARGSTRGLGKGRTPRRLVARRIGWNRHPATRASTARHNGFRNEGFSGRDTCTWYWGSFRRSRVSLHLKVEGMTTMACRWRDGLPVRGGHAVCLSRSY